MLMMVVMVIVMLMMLLVGLCRTMRIATLPALSSLDNERVWGVSWVNMGGGAELLASLHGLFVQVSIGVTSKFHLSTSFNTLHSLSLSNSSLTRLRNPLPPMPFYQREELEMEE